MYNMGKYVPNTIKIWKKDGVFKLTFKKNYKTKITKLNMIMNNRNYYFFNCTKSSKMEWPPIDSK
jgi:hypothetical protein